MKIICLFALLVPLLLASCGPKEIIRSNTVTKEVTTIEKPQNFEGMFICDNFSRVELMVDYLGQVSFETSNQILNSINPSTGNIDTHPAISEKDLEAVGYGNLIVLTSKNYNYSSSGNDVSEDLTGAQITGNHRTDIYVSSSDENLIEIKILIFDGPIGAVSKVVVERSISCER